jgi:hypothetical protein
MHKQRIIIIVIAGLGMLATFMPWIKAPIIGSVNGTDGDGWITLVLFAVALVMSLLGDRTQKIKTKKIYIASLVCIIAAVVGILDIIDINSSIEDIGSGIFSEELNISVGYGLYLIVLAGIAIPVYLFVDKKKTGSYNKPPQDTKPDAEVR